MIEKLTKYEFDIIADIVYSEFDWSSVYHFMNSSEWSGYKPSNMVDIYNNVSFLRDSLYNNLPDGHSTIGTLGFVLQIKDDKLNLFFIDDKNYDLSDIKNAYNSTKFKCSVPIKGTLRKLKINDIINKENF